MLIDDFILNFAVMINCQVMCFKYVVCYRWILCMQKVAEKKVESTMEVTSGK